MTIGLFFLANLLFCLAYMVRNMLFLRAITILAALSTLPYFYLQEDPLYSAMGWQTAFIVINAYNMGVLLLEKRPVALDEEAQWLHRHTFRMLSPLETVKLLRPSQARYCNAHDTLVEEDETLEELILIVRGTADVYAGGSKRATLEPGDFVGEMGFMTGRPASAQVVARESLDYRVWRRQDLLALYDRDARLKDAMQMVIGTDMARKLGRQGSGSPA
jgi:hypothetical protein